MLSKYHYYTGIIFKAYTYGTGDYIVTGGRYDKLLVQFGKDTPAVGFAIVVDQLMAALSRQQIPVEIPALDLVLLYEPEASEEAVSLGRRLRLEGRSVWSVRRQGDKSLSDYKELAARRGSGQLLYLKEKGQEPEVLA